MRNRPSASRRQLFLDLELPRPREPLVKNPTGLVEALADLLLEAAEAERTGGANELEDHA
jgi:hypothetical protein